MISPLEKVDYNEFFISAFLDIAKAFDTVDHGILLVCLIFIIIPCYVLYAN